MSSLNHKQAINIKENNTLSACMDTAKYMVHKKNDIAYKGKNIGIAILDTGISPVDDFILPYNRIIAFRDFVQHRTNPYDDNGHGTHPAYQVFYFILLFNSFCTL